MYRHRLPLTLEHLAGVIERLVQVQVLTKLSEPTGLLATLEPLDSSVRVRLEHLEGLLALLEDHLVLV